MDFEYNIKYQQFTQAVLNVTNDCNLACTYCFVNQSCVYMPVETGYSIIDICYQNYLEKNDGVKPLIYFFGGEPLMAYMTVIKPVILYAEQKYPDIFNFGITTNGTYLNEEHLKFFKEHKVSLLLSIDGGEDTQNYNRPMKDITKNSFDFIVSKIPLFLKYYPNVCFRSTVSREKCNNLFQDYLFAEQSGFKKYFCLPDHRHPWTEEQINILLKELEKIFIYRTNEFLSGINPMDFDSINWAYATILRHDLQILYKEGTEDLIDKWQDIDRCGLGTQGVAIGYDGSIYACQEQTTRSAKNDIFYLGNIYEQGVEIERHKRLLSLYYNTSQHHECEDKKICKECLLYKTCNVKSCISTNYDLFNNFITEPKIRCLWNQALLMNARVQMKILQEQKNELFEKYLKHFTLYSNNFILNGDENNVNSNS